MQTQQQTTPTITWTGQSGAPYRYEVYPLNQEFKKAPGNYIIAKLIGPSQLKALYVGETGDLSERFDGHHKMPSILRNGATHICAHLSPDSAVLRRAEEQDLIAALTPPCNG